MYTHIHTQQLENTTRVNQEWYREVSQDEIIFIGPTENNTPHLGLGHSIQCWKNIPSSLT